MTFVKCNCNSVPLHYKTQKQGPNFGRWFYTVTDL